jgi:hypothetical protein
MSTSQSGFESLEAYASATGPEVVPHTFTHTWSDLDLASGWLPADSSTVTYECAIPRISSNISLEGDLGVEPIIFMLSHVCCTELTRDYLSLNRPFIMVDALTHAPARHTWTKDGY